jgi:hypothetical protein
MPVDDLWFSSRREYGPDDRKPARRLIMRSERAGSGGGAHGDLCPICAHQW